MPCSSQQHRSDGNAWWQGQKLAPERRPICVQQHLPKRANGTDCFTVNSTHPDEVPQSEHRMIARRPNSRHGAQMGSSLPSWTLLSGHSTSLFNDVCALGLLVFSQLCVWVSRCRHNPGRSGSLENSVAWCVHFPFGNRRLCLMIRAPLADPAGLVRLACALWGCFTRRCGLEWRRGWPFPTGHFVCCGSVVATADHDRRTTAANQRETHRGAGPHDGRNGTTRADDTTADTTRRRPRHDQHSLCGPGTHAGRTSTTWRGSSTLSTVE